MLKNSTRLEQMEHIIHAYCAQRGISRAPFDAETTVDEERFEALTQLVVAHEDDPVIPAGLPGTQAVLSNVKGTYQ